MAWYRSIGIDTPDIVKPEFIEEYKESAIGYTQARTFTVVNPGLYFLANFGTINILTLSTSSQNPVLYDMNYGSRTNDKFRLMHLDAGDTVTYSGDGYSNQCWTYLAIRIVNAEFFSTKYAERTTAGATLTYSNEIDDNPHFIFYKVNGSSIGTDNSNISQDCNVLDYGISGNAWSSAKCIGLVSNDDLAYINTTGNATSVVLDFVLQPTN